MSHTAAQHVTEHSTSPKLDPPFSGVGKSSTVMMTTDGGNDTEQEEGGVSAEKPKKTDKSSPKKRAAGHTEEETTSPKKKRAAAKGKVAIKTPDGATKTVADLVETIAAVAVESKDDTSEGQVRSIERPSTPEAQTVKETKTPKTPKTPKSPDGDNVVEANDATPKQPKAKTHPAKPKANANQSPVKGKRAGAEKVADKVVLPTNWSEASEADKMLVRTKEAGRPWSEIRVKWYEMMGQDTAPSTLPNRYPPRDIVPPSRSTTRSRSTSTSVSSSPPAPVRRPRKRRRQPNTNVHRHYETKEGKLELIHDTIAGLGWSITDVLKQYTAQSTDPKYRTFYLGYRRYLLGKGSTVGKAMLGPRLFQAVMKDDGVARTAHFFRRELDALSKTECFGKYVEAEPRDAEDEGEGSLDFIEDLAPTAQQHAPYLLKFLALLSKPATQRRDVDVNPQPNQLIWMSMLLYSMRRKKCNNIPRLFGMYCMNSGVKKRIIDVLSSIGLCASYTSILECQKGQTDVGAKRIALMASDPRVMIDHDNFDFPDVPSGERINDRKTFVSLTNGALIIGRNIRTAGLKQSMWKPQGTLLSARELTGKVAGHKSLLPAKLSNAWHAVKVGLPGILDDASPVSSIDGESKTLTQEVDDLFPWPDIDRLTNAVVKYRPLAPVWANEGTNEGTIQVMDDYMEKQFDEDPDNEQKWSDRLLLWHGDVKTIQRLLSVQAIRANTSERAYDRKAWVFPVMGLWHLKYNLLKLIRNTHFGGSSPIDDTCIQFAADKWDRTNANRVDDFQKLEELLIHSYQSRIMGLLLHQSGRYFSRREDVENWIKGMSASDVSQRIKDVVEAFNPPDFEHQDGREDGPPVHNQQWLNHQCFIRHMDVYLLLRRAIKLADVGVLKEALREACILFQAKGAKCDNYAPELLRLLHTCDTEAAAGRLRNAVINNMLVNLSGKAGRTFETDRLVEFINRLVSITKKNRINSTKSLESLLREITLTAPYALKLKVAVERTFGRVYPGRHPLKPAHEDIWVMAKALSQGSLKTMNQEANSAYVALNLRREGLRSLPDNIHKYNLKLLTMVSPQDDEEYTEGPDNPDQIERDEIGLDMESMESNMDEVMETLLHEMY
ncbi:MAG: hypothetical protein Q9180_001421 [Flavoplaca navasiana]